MDFGEFLLFALSIFFLFAWLMVLFIILSDLFRDSTVNGWIKALWVIALLFLPFITALIYLIVRGRGMTERRVEEMKQMQAAQHEYIKSVAGGTNPADQIAQAKQLLDSGAISQEEFDAIKAKALA